MAVGARHYGDIRATAAATGCARVEIDPARIDDLPRTFSGGMQQRLQIARTLVTQPRLVFMDEPTGGLDVSVQARLLDLIRALVARARPRGADRHARHRRGAAAGAPHAGDAQRPGGGAGADRPRAGRPAASLHAAARLLGAGGMSAMTPRSRARTRAACAKPFTLHLQGGVRCRCCDGVDLPCAPANAWRWPARRAPASPR